MGKSYPDPPDPKVTAGAQTGTNVTTALANAQLRNVDQYTADGSRTWTTDPSGAQSFTDPSSGARYNVPKYVERVTLSPAQQAIKDQNDRAGLNLSTLAGDLSGKLSTKLNDNFTIGNDATEARLFELGRKRLDPVNAERQSALDAKLANQGIGIGSKAYEVAQRQNYEAENDGYNQLLLSGRGQATQEQFAEDNQRINQISALLSGGQVSQPNFLGTNQPTLPTVDYAGLVNENYNQRLGIAQAKNQTKSQIAGGLFSLGSAFISDRRAKTNISRIGTADNGLPIYSYQYIWGGPFQIGFMADEVEKVNPDAVMEFRGIKRVNYERAVQ